MSSLADQLQRVIYRLKSEGADKVQRDFEKIEGAAEGVAREAINVEKAVATIGVQAEQTQSRLRRMVDAGSSGFTSLKGTLGQIGGGFQSAIRGVNDLTSKLGPWNQALELGGKAVKFVDESFDVLAKKEPGRRAEIEATRKSMQGLGDSVKVATAEFALFITQQAEFARGPIEEARKTYERINKQIRDFYKLDRGSAAAQGLGYLLNGGASDAVREKLASSWGGGLDETIGAGLDRLGEAGKKLDEENRKLARENEQRHKSMLAEWAKRERDVSEFIGKQGMDDVVGNPVFEWDPDAVSLAGMRERKGLGAAADTTQRNKYGAVDGEDAIIARLMQASEEQDRILAHMADGYDQFMTDRANSKLEKVFGPIDDVDVYDQAFAKLGDTFNAFGEAVGSSYEAIVIGAGGASAAFKRVIADGLMAIGKSSAVSAIRETALGFGALAFGSPTASMHFKSAALHGAVAVAAGAAARGMGAGAGAAAPSGGGGSSSSASGGGASTGTGQSSESKGKETVIVAYLDPWANQPEHIRRSQAKEMAQNVLGSSAVDHS